MRWMYGWVEGGAADFLRKLESELASGVKREPRMAPWADYAGYPIHEGDTLRHPSGEIGLVVFKSEHAEPCDQWRVDYDDDAEAPLSRLVLQIGVKGGAVVANQGGQPGSATRVCLKGELCQ